MERDNQPMPPKNVSEEEKMQWQEAFNSFAMVLVEPFKVDWVQLGVKPNQRTVFTRNDEDQWEEHIVAP